MPSGDAEYGKLHEWEEGRPIILPLRDEGAEHVGDDSIDTFGLGIRLMMVRRPKDQSSSEGSMQSRPEFRSKAESDQVPARGIAQPWAIQLCNEYQTYFAKLRIGLRTSRFF